MELEVRRSVTILEVTAGAIILLNIFGDNFLLNLLISIAVVFMVAHFFGKPIREAVQTGKLRETEVKQTLLKSPYLWGALIVGFTGITINAIYS